MIRSALSMCRRAATALAVVAALAFVIDGALGGSHLVPTASAHGLHHHSRAHAHGDAPVLASDHRLINGDGAADTDVSAQQHAPAPASGSDSDANGCACACTCCAVALQPSVVAQATPFMLIRDIAFSHPRHGEGIAPDGLRRPPRPLGIA